MGWKNLTEEQQNDLIEWYNVRPEVWTDLTSQDKVRLAKLFEDGRFRAWECPNCGERVYCGDPEDWGHFQGVRQVDYVSYPGDIEVYQASYLEQLCDECRMHGG